MNNANGGIFFPTDNFSSNMKGFKDLCNFLGNCKLFTIEGIKGLTSRFSLYNNMLVLTSLLTIA